MQAYKPRGQWQTNLANRRFEENTISKILIFALFFEILEQMGVASWKFQTLPHVSVQIWTPSRQPVVSKRSGRSLNITALGSRVSGLQS